MTLGILYFIYWIPVQGLCIVSIICTTKVILLCYNIITIYIISLYIESSQQLNYVPVDWNCMGTVKIAIIIIYYHTCLLLHILLNSHTKLKKQHIAIILL